MSKLIQALQIFLKYGDPNFPTHCEHDILMICGYAEDTPSPADVEALSELSFTWDDEYDCWASALYGSA